MLSAADVSAHILLKLGTIEQVRLQRLLYFCQAGSLAWLDAPLFEDSIEAWANGPVVVSIWNKHRYEYRISSEPTGNPEKLTLQQRDVVKSVLKAYGHLSLSDIIALAHNDPIWFGAYKERKLPYPPVSLSMDDVSDYYRHEWAY